MPSRFDRDTAAAPRGEGVYDARIDEGWWIDRGPNGGYLAGMITRALLAETAGSDQNLRSITTHYLAPPVAGPTFPGYPQPDELAHVPGPPGMSELRNRYEYLHTMGAPWDEPGEAALTGGWIRLRESRPYDAALIAHSRQLSILLTF